MKNKILLISLFSIAFSFAQQTLKVEYNQIYNSDFPVIRTAILQANEKNSIYVDIMKSRRDLLNPDDVNFSYLEKLNVDENTLNGQKFSLVVGANFDKFFFYDVINDKLSYTDELGKKQFYIIDDFKLNWQITKETKTIANYKTYKAITKFRGRTWEAWFAPELAYPYGPWKLHGLPGLILEAYDITRRYNFTAIKVFKDKTNLTFSPDKLPKLSFKDFKLRNFEFIENILTIPVDNNTKVIKHDVGRKGLELIYEWETETPTN
nr:GLPGLI family protein [uncultured Flavobacterium sp.]